MEKNYTSLCGLFRREGRRKVSSSGDLVDSFCCCTLLGTASILLHGTSRLLSPFLLTATYLFLLHLPQLPPHRLHQAAKGVALAGLHYLPHPWQAVFHLLHRYLPPTPCHLPVYPLPHSSGRKAAHHLPHHRRRSCRLPGSRWFFVRRSRRTDRLDASGLPAGQALLPFQLPGTWRAAYHGATYLHTAPRRRYPTWLNRRTATCFTAAFYWQHALPPYHVAAPSWQRLNTLRTAHSHRILLFSGCLLACDTLSRASLRHRRCNDIASAV